MVCRGLSLSFVVAALRALQQRPVVMPGGLDPDSLSPEHPPRPASAVGLCARSPLYLAATRRRS